MLRPGVVPALVVFSVGIALGCTKRTETSSTTSTATESETVTTETVATTSSAAAAPAVPPAAAPAAAMASGTYSADANIRADLLEVRRISGGAVLVTWRVVNTSPDAKARYDFGWDDIYFVDPAENKKYGYLTDSAGNRILDIWWGELKPGEQRQNWAKFPAPPPTSTKISLTLPKFAPFEDVPVAQ